MRDEQTDIANIQSIAAAIERSLKATETEHAGLSGRMEDAALRAAIVVGNDTNEYLSREKEQNAYLHLLENELQSGRDRINILQQNISHLVFLRTALFSRFPQACPKEYVGS
jgi:chromosome segregation ATPase